MRLQVDVVIWSEPISRSSSSRTERNVGSPYSLQAAVRDCWLIRIDGLPALPTHTQTRLNHTILHSSSSSATVPALSPGIPVSKTLATLHLALRHRAQQQPITQPELAKLVSQIKNVKIEVKEAEAWRKQARGMLDAAGGIWADAAKRIEGAATA